MLVTRPDEKSKPVRKMSDWSPAVELLSALLDRVGELIQATAALGGAKPHRVPPAPRPVTALDRARYRRLQQRHESLSARVLPRKAPPAGDRRVSG